MKIVHVSTELISRIRDHISRTQKRIKLLENQKKWLQLTSSLDVLADSTCAIVYYCETKYPVTVGGQYLFIYGLLQALYLQQDAIKGIAFALFDENIDFKKDFPDAYAAREFRNDVVGHPTNRTAGKEFVYLVQSSLGKTEFSYFRQTPNERRDDSFVTVDVQKAIGDDLDPKNWTSYNVRKKKKRLTKELKENGKKELHSRADHRQAAGSRTALQPGQNDYRGL